MIVVDASALRIEPQFDGEGLAKALVVQLGRDLGPAQSDGEPVDLGVRLRRDVVHQFLERPRRARQHRPRRARGARRGRGSGRSRSGRPGAVLS